MKILLHLLLIIFIASCSDLDQEYVKNNHQKAKNIIILIGDGMGNTQITYHLDNLKDQESNFTKFKYSGLVRTYSKNSLITDSASSATSIATGYKVPNRALSILDGRKLPTLFEIAKKSGKKTGFVVTSSVLHATPATFYAHQETRYMKEGIADDLLNSDIDFISGADLDFFQKHDYLKKFQNKDYKLFHEQKDFNIDAKKIFYLENNKHLDPKNQNRNEYLINNSLKALEFLSKGEKGFILLIESSQIDFAGHNNDPEYLLAEIKEFDKLIGKIINFADNNQGTLVVLTSDHETGGLTLITDEKDYITDSYDINFSTSGHSASMVPIFAYGTAAEKFTGIIDNIDIFQKISSHIK
jgi:alkaline phosphatase